MSLRFLTFLGVVGVLTGIKWMLVGGAIGWFVGEAQVPSVSRH